MLKTWAGVSIARSWGAEGTTPHPYLPEAPYFNQAKEDVSEIAKRLSTAIFWEHDTDVNVLKSRYWKSTPTSSKASPLAEDITPQFFKKCNHELHEYYHPQIPDIFQKTREVEERRTVRTGESVETCKSWPTGSSNQWERLDRTVKAAEQWPEECHRQ